MSEERTVKIGIIGLGARAETLLASIFEMHGIQVTAVCDTNPDRIARIESIFDNHKAARPKTFTDFRGLLDDPGVEAVFVPTSWNSHLLIACEAMKRGKYVGIEVGGASSVEELWQLVHASESTGVSCMMLENCCYGRKELMVLNMVRKGLFGELLYCECGYEHDLSEMSWAVEKRFERTIHNMHRNGDLYPTHGIGPIAKILRINRGNRFMTISSHATKARGFVTALEDHTGKRTDTVFHEGDIVTSVIHCANGENITVTHGVSLPRPYSRDQRVQGTKGIWLENAKGIYVDGISPKYEKLDVAGNPYTTHEWSPVESFYEKYDHPIWQDFRNNVIGEHGGMDALAMSAFLDAVRRKAPTPIDVYDVAAWMSITCLSEQSIAMGGMPVPFPDFTNGKWIDREPEIPSKWSLNEVY
ncbi:MAG: Gfo/Idh/MocA family oxidoreductase [Lentisphaeria bacterium]|nr:Gfo/Idh/MocA family oxidoreductase [Lentisphaeria bacterium]